MESLPCEELRSLERRLRCAIERKNELICANLLGKWMMAAEADLTRTNELLMHHSQTCLICNPRWRELTKVESRPEDSDADQEPYPPEDPDRPFRAPPRRMLRPHPASVLQFPSVDSRL